MKVYLIRNDKGEFHKGGNFPMFTKTVQRVYNSFASGARVFNALNAGGFLDDTIELVEYDLTPNSVVRWMKDGE